MSKIHDLELEIMFKNIYIVILLFIIPQPIKAYDTADVLSHVGSTYIGGTIGYGLIKGVCDNTNTFSLICPKSKFARVVVSSLAAFAGGVTQEVIHSRSLRLPVDRQD